MIGECSTSVDVQGILAPSYAHLTVRHDQLVGGRVPVVDC